MATTKQPTNSDILAELKSMGARVSALETRAIVEDAAKKGVAEYRKQEEADNRNRINASEKQEWAKVAKQVGIILGIVIAILYAYAATKGLHL